MRRAAQLIARGAGWLSRRLGRGGGTTVPGVVLLKLRPQAVRELSRGLRRGSVVISATNGKTTTARLLRSVVDDAGWSSVANTAGSNLLRGVAAALLDGADDADFGLFEVDEAALDTVTRQLEPRVVVLMNLFRDQLDRYGELETLVARWHSLIASLPEDVVVVLDADDPSVAHLGAGRSGVVYFGLDDRSQGRGGLAHAADSKNCPRCDQPLEYTLVTIGHLGHWNCPACGLTRPTPQISLRTVEITGIDSVRIEVQTPAAPVCAELALPGLHNAYNATAAIAAAHALGIDMPQIGSSLAHTQAAFGRGERISLEGRDLLLLLAKNPAGANENVRTVGLAAAPVHLLLFLNDRTADGQDVSWIWDVDYEPLFDRAASITIGGDRAHDMALRFVYGGCERDRITVCTAVAEAIDHAVDATPAGATLYVLPTYTAMLDLRAELVQRGVARAFWEEAP
jgi:UDP-N-acetylmuramyl tripeptide synthase